MNDLMGLASHEFGDFAEKIVLFHIASLLFMRCICVLRAKFLLMTILYIICVSYKMMSVA